MESQVVLVINKGLMEYFARKGLKLEEFSLLLLLSRQRVDLLESYLRRNLTAEQKAATFQALVRKQLVVTKDNNSFRLEDYEITEEGRAILTDTEASTNMVEIVATSLNIPTEDRTEFDVFVEKYLELFPKGVKNGGNKPLRSNVTDTKAKMIKFMNKYKHSQGTILEATSRFIERLRGVYTYCPTAEYFIMKDGSSALATECDGARDGTDELIDPFLKRM